MSRPSIPCRRCDAPATIAIPVLPITPLCDACAGISGMTLGELAERHPTALMLPFADPVSEHMRATLRAAFPTGR